MPALQGKATTIKIHTGSHITSTLRWAFKSFTFLIHWQDVNAGETKERACERSGATG